MYDYWVVTERSTGRVISHCGEERDALMMISFDKHNRTYRKQKFILDQVIDVESDVDKQLPGQLGLPQGQDRLTFDPEKISLPQSEATPINI